MNDAKNEVDPPPDLQEWVHRCGGYQNIDWLAWDRAVADWQARRQARLQREQQASQHFRNKQNERRSS